ncbi:MAG: MtrB/PioB family decaheme-associated outer membrane protein [Pseudohongiellaceae bacterium]
MSLSWPRVCAAICASMLVQTWASTAAAQNSSVEIGLGYNSEDSYQLGQYSGLTQSGEFAVGGFSFSSANANTGDPAWSLSAKNLGLESRSLEAIYQRSGSFSVSLNYDQLPHYQYNDGRTPFNGSGSQLQSLPSDWTGAGSTSGFSTLSSSLKQVNIDTRRDRFTGAFDWQLSPLWELMGEVRHEIKEGSETLGAIFGSSGGNPRGSILARPIDYQIDEATVGLSFARQNTQYAVSYTAMQFSNKDKALRFQNPFNNAGWSAGANFSDGAIGQIGLEPDNSSSQVSLSGVHRFGKSTRLSASVVSTRLEQDDSYLPYSSVFAATTPLPRADLGARVDMLVANLNLSTRLNRRSTLRLRYNYRDRDNKTSQEVYQRIAGDSAPQSGLLSSQTRINRLYDTERGKFSADLNYRLSSKAKFFAGYENVETDRSMVDVATTEEDTGFIKLSFTPFPTSSGWIKLTRSERDASQYDSTVPFVSGHNPDYVATLVGNQLFENDPLLRRFHLSDRERDELSASLNFYPSDGLSLSLLALLADDAYPDAKVGLQKSEKRSFSTDMSYAPAANWSSSIYYSYDEYSNQQAGFGRRGGGNPTPFYPESLRDPGNNWSMKSEDLVHTIGAGVDWEIMAGKLDLSLDANYTDAKSKTTPFSSGVAYLPLPDLNTEITSISLSSKYQLQPGRALSVGYTYGRFKSDDWALDGAGVNTLSNILLLGNQSPEYSAHIVQVSLLIDLH